ncbi:LacI family DNA-binding transcriptional regulator [Bordetella genomosp. 11]|uniref:LacI family DNA-binding transcriptional regulator n=1 Tax=Bordetella genomosp. 11 TaxID=1416808 RepID=UPI0015959C02|nr:LacI family DNA-binding transcriptional regulator [Bordetella genomosp. 11]
MSTQRTTPTLPKSRATRGQKNGYTQKDVAREAGVSQSAVSRVFAGRGYVAAEVRQQIEKAARKLGYLPDMAARSLVKGRSNIVAVVTSNITHPFVPQMLEKMTLAIQQRGQEVLLLNSPPGQDIDRQLPLALRYRVKGILIANVSIGARVARQVRQSGTPIVMVNRYVEEKAVHGVSCDNVHGSRLVALDFIAAGKRRIAYIGGLPDSPTNVVRRDAFLHALREHGITPEVVLEGAFSHAWGYEAAGILRQRHAAVDAVLCGDDMIAIGMLDGYRGLPGGLAAAPAIVGFDDIPNASWPPYMLTTYSNPLDRMIDRALDLLEQPADCAPVREVLQGELVRRASF